MLPARTRPCLCFAVVRTAALTLAFPCVQQLGFIMVSVLFWVSAGKYDWLVRKNNIGVFQFIYFFSSFWGQFGPNCTTFLLAGAPPFYWSIALMTLLILPACNRVSAGRKPPPP